VEVSTLGGFSIKVAGREVKLAPQVSRLVKLVASESAAVHVEVVIETLWPDVDARRGRRRLRNVMARLHRSAGALLDRHGDLISLARGVQVDLQSLEAALSQAIESFQNRGDWAAARMAALHAGQLYTRPFLPEDLYEPWAESRRYRLSRRYLRMLELWASAAREAGDLAELEDCLRAAIDADPDDEKHYLELAHLLADTGRPAAAKSLLDRSALAAARLGVDVSPALASFATHLAGSPKRPMATAGT
jgi:DNA-binding SARP family transcriptional activator